MSSASSMSSTGRGAGGFPRGTARHRRSRHRDAIDEIGHPRIPRRLEGQARLGRLCRLRRLRRPSGRAARFRPMRAWRGRGDAAVSGNVGTLSAVRPAARFFPFPRVPLLLHTIRPIRAIIGRINAKSRPTWRTGVPFPPCRGDGFDFRNWHSVGEDVKRILAAFARLDGSSAPAFEPIVPKPEPAAVLDGRSGRSTALPRAVERTTVKLYFFAGG